MKVLTINGPPHAKGNTAIAINEMIRLSNEQAGYDAGKKEGNNRLFAWCCDT